MNFNINDLSDILDQINRISQMDRALEQLKSKDDIKIETEPEAKVETKPVERPKRCQMTDCKTKLILSDFACQCKGYYCSKHRHSETHSCSFDYRAATSKLLEKGLVKTVADKLERI
jgi:predicted nucleic acid binding AN1-type Zn finger protein